MTSEGELLRDLQESINADDYKGVIATSDRHKDVIQCKVAALLQLSQFKAAVDLLSVHADVTSHLVFERAYAFYRTKQHAQAMEVIKAVPEAVKSYRFGHFERTIDIYERAFSAADLDIEMKTNLLAAYISAGQADKALAAVASWRLGPGDLTYETAYNTACAMIDAGDLAAAQRQLEVAEGLARASLAEEGASAKEMVDETAGIQVQQAYVLQLQDQTDRAADIYNSVLAAKPSDTSVSATASNNLITLRRSHERVFDSLKRSARAFQVDEEKLSQRQKRAIQLNRCLLLMHQGKAAGEQSRTIVESLGREFPDSELPVLALAALHCRERRFDQCAEVLRLHIAAKPAQSPRCRLALVHVPLLRGDVAGALAELRAVHEAPELAHRPAVVAVTVALCERNKDFAAAAQALEQAAHHWAKQNPAAEPRARALASQMLEESARLRLQHRMWPEAAQAFESLMQAQAQASGKDGKDGEAKEARRRYSAGLVLALAQTDLAQAQQQAAKLLPALDAVGVATAGLDAVELENLSAPRVERKKDRAATEDEDDEGDGEGESASPAGARDKGDKKKKLRKRKSRMPKAFDPANPAALALPDPDRWKPRWQRESSKKQGGRRKRRQDVGKGAQGATTEAGAADDRTGGPPAQVAVGPQATTKKTGPMVSKFRDRAARRRMKKM